MADICRVRVAWTGGSVVGPAVSTFYFDGAGSGWTASLSTFFNAIKTSFPTSLTWSIPNQGDILDTSSGDIIGSWVDGSPTPVFGTSSNQIVAGTGARIRWKTNGLRGGRRVTGATFLAPCDATLFDTVGTLDNTRRAAIETAAGSLISAEGHILGIWSKPHKDAADGLWSPVTAAEVPDKVSSLRSRRV